MYVPDTYRRITGESFFKKGYWRYEVAVWLLGGWIQGVDLSYVRVMIRAMKNITQSLVSIHDS